MFVLHTLISLAFLATATFSFTTEALRPCHLDDFKYEYTECDSDGGRWRVSVPKEPGLCQPGNSPSVPERGKECNFACNTGEYLDIQGDQQCHSCPPGTYSLGGGIRFDDWQTLPPGFAVKTEHVSHTSWGSRFKHKGNCSRAEWKPRSSYIMSVPGDCPSNLLFSAKLVRAGKVSFEYQYTDPETIFHFMVQNDQCQALDGEDNDKWPAVTTEGKWATIVVELKSGMNVLQWRTIGALSEMMHSTVSPILIRKIEITGVAYTSECTKCANGTYSSGGTSFCQICPVNTFSNHGASQCLPCKDGEYSEPGSATCTEKPPCTEFDYYSFQTACNKDGQTQMTHRWIQPKICNEKAGQSVVLPVNGVLDDCPPCNPGMHQLNMSHCGYCNENQFADSQSVCRDCAVSTSPKYEVHYKHWTGMPPNMTTRCISIGMESCSNTAGWVPAGDRLRTSFGLRDNNIFLVLVLKVAGFRGEPGTVDGKPITLSTISFELDLHCESPCQLIFLSDALGRNTVLQTWEETMEKTVFSHEIFTNESVTFTWAFQPDDFGLADPGDEVHTSRMKNLAQIYNLKVTNTLSGGASQCESCPEGKSADGCIPCSDGHYVDPQSQRCQACPAGTVLPSSNSWGQDSCKKCGPGLHPVGGRSCKSDCRFTDDMGREYDFTELDGLHYVSGARLFTASGTQYYHSFNISLCNHGNTPLPTCVNNVSADAVLIGQPSYLSSMVCRSTLVPQGDPEKPVVSTQPVSLGTHLTKIVSNISLLKQYEEEGLPSEDSERDIHFYYESGSTTSACPNGRVSIISLHCDPKQKGTGEIQLPPKCADGTCDGCTFHFLWLTRHACPACRKEDYKVVRGECVDGEQAIHYFPPQHCLELSQESLSPMSQKCRVLPFAVMVSIPVILGTGLFLILLLIYCWSRNKKLEYKYMKLVETAGGHDGELPAADTCGMEDEDEDDVHFADERTGASFFSKIREKFGSSNRMKDDDNPFVAVKMSEKMSLT
ncbi:endosome/lysosome-associated apoptosis and autophagy regulator family member 2 [Aplysia californica]|uniref:Endosome/lysosome-associated apoptosis and autophagy regulator family member 2 n=1 Tax=Aplysia californica TaxID=6500 RepID=A0ABM1VTT5_APLCA|nr:endosome/lysosome-associated apoptosis and autophagy regulator family member 2 [Aplysia californica]